MRVSRSWRLPRRQKNWPPMRSSRCGSTSSPCRLPLTRSRASVLVARMRGSRVTRCRGAYQAGCQSRTSQQDMLSALELSIEAFAAIKNHCDEQGVIFLVTPFGPADVTRLASLQVAALKIASTDLTNEPLLNAASQTGLPLILSTGASTEDEIRRCVGARTQQGALDRLVLMHCVSAYPTPLDAVNLRTIATLRRAFRVPCGLSDHTTSVETGAWAVAAGACILPRSVGRFLCLDRT